MGAMVFLLLCAICDVGAWKIMEAGAKKSKTSVGEVPEESEHSVLHASLQQGLTSAFPSGRVAFDKSRTAIVPGGPKEKWYESYNSVPIKSEIAEELGGGKDSGAELVKREFQLNADYADFEAIKRKAPKPKFTLSDGSDTDSSESEELGIQVEEDQEGAQEEEEELVATRGRADSSTLIKVKKDPAPKQNNTEPEAQKLQGEVMVKDHWFKAELSLKESGKFDAYVLPSVLADEMEVSGQTFSDLKGSQIRMSKDSAKSIPMQ